MAKRILIAAGLLIAINGAEVCLSQDPEKLTAADVVARHLESIGSAEARAAVKSRVAQGSAIAIIRIGGRGQSKGGAVMASQGRMSLIGIIFGPQEYSNERFAFDGKKLMVGEWKPGVRTRLGGFLLTHDIMFQEGLIGGTLSAAWPLLNLSERNPKLRYAGIKKVEGKPSHVLEYDSRSGNLEIRLYFDAETFQHVRSDYEHEIDAATVSRPEDAAKQKTTRLKLVEDFSDYRKEGVLNLPHSYKIQLTFDSDNNSLLQEWILTLNQFLFNKELPATQFDLNAK